MKIIKLLLLISLLFFESVSFSQNTVTYTPLINTINLNSGEEGTVDVQVNCYGNSSNPVFLNATLSCGNNDGILSQSYTNGNVLTPGQNTKIRFKFKKAVIVDTQIVYKFSTNGSCQQPESQMIIITVNYKKGSTTPPTIDPNSIFIEAWPNFSVTINEGDIAPVMAGAGLSGYTYQWYKSVDGIFTLIPNATRYYYNPGTPFVTTKYYRRAQLGLNSAPISNELLVTVIPSPVVLKNNMITLNGSKINGSLPTGGINSYQYSWTLWGGEEPYTFPDTGQDFEITADTYNYLNSYPNLFIARTVTSGRQSIGSNWIQILPIPDIQNNFISIDGKQINGSLPSGGTGNFRYEYFIAYSYNGEYIDTNAVGTDQNYTISNHSLFTTEIWRKVYSGNKVSTSNIIKILPGDSLNKDSSVNTQTVSSDLIAYPNPTSESINFSTNFSSDREIEIVLYSEKSQNGKSIFKGNVAPNQVVKWSIPSSYQKGIYYYRIISDSKEVKTGKILYQ